MLFFKLFMQSKIRQIFKKSHILDVILKYFYNSAICMFTAFAWWRKKQPVRFQPAVFLLNILKERMFLVISCWKLVVLSWFHQRKYNMISSGRQIFLYVPIYGYILFFSGVFYVFLDGINQITVFVWECVWSVFWLVCHCLVWQYVYIKVRSPVLAVIFLTMVKEMAIFFHIFYFSWLFYHVYF